MATQLVRLEIFIPNIPNIDVPDTVASFISQSKQLSTLPVILLFSPLNGLIIQINTTAANVTTLAGLLPQLATALGLPNIVSYQFPVTQN